MKVYYLTCVLLLFASIARADCAGNGITCWPQSATLNKDPLIIVTFYGNSQRVADSLNNKYPVYLLDDTCKIKLVVTEICKGEFEVTQVLFKPAEELIEGHAYQLFIDSMHDHISAIPRYNAATKKMEAAKWTLTEQTHTGTAKLTEAPIIDSEKYVEYGCGPERWLYFSWKKIPENIPLVYATLTHKKTGRQTSYYLEVTDNKVAVGHGMCAGAFYFDTENEYEITFTSVDAHGNKAPGSSAPLKFSAPFR